MNINKMKKIQIFRDTFIATSSQVPQQVQSTASNIDRPLNQPNGHISQDDLLLNQPNGHLSPADCNLNRPNGQLSQDDRFHSSEYCELYSTTSSTKLCHQPVAIYFEIFIEDATDRLADAFKFFYDTSSYTFKFEYHIKILNDLLEELANPPPNLKNELYTCVSQLSRRLRLLHQHLIGRRNLLLGYTKDHSENVEISVPAGAEMYVKAAAEAKAARERQRCMVVLIQRIADLKRKEEKCKKLRLEAEGQIIRYLDHLAQFGNDGQPKNEKSNPCDQTASGNIICVFIYLRVKGDPIVIRKFSLRDIEEYNF